MRERAVLFRWLSLFVAWMGMGWLLFALMAERARVEIGMEVQEPWRITVVGYPVAMVSFALSAILWYQGRRDMEQSADVWKL